MTAPEETPRRLAEHVILVSIDGLRPELRRDERWPAPMLQELAREGAIPLAARSVFPALTYPAHATAADDVERIADDVRDVLSTLPAGLRALFRIVGREELDALGADPQALFALAAVPGVAFLTTAVGPAERAAHGAGHGYHPDVPDMTTGFLAAGAGVRPGAVAPLLPLENVAPLIAMLLGVSLPAGDGVLFRGPVDGS